MAENKITKAKSAADLPPMVLLAGKEDLLIERLTDKIIATGVSEADRDFNLDVLYGSDVRAAQIISIARSFPMMAERRVVIVRDIDKLPAADLAQLAAYAGQPNPSTCLVLVLRSSDLRQKALKELRERSEFIECKPLYESQIVPWIQQEVQQQGRTISQEAAGLLAAQVGTDLRTMVNEIEKLTLYVAADDEISTEAVARVAGFRKEYTIFALQNALGERNLGQVIQIYDHLKSTMAAQVVLFQLTRFFTNLLVATGFRPQPQDNAELARITGTHSYFVRDLHKFKRKYSVQELESALENLCQVDYLLKSTSVDESVLMHQLFVHIVRGYPAKRLPFAANSA